MNADKHSPLQVRRALSGGWGDAYGQWELKAPTDRSRSDCVHEQVAKRIANVRFTADKHSPLQVRRALSGGWGDAYGQWELKAPTDRSRSDCVHEQVAKRIANVRFT